MRIITQSILDQTDFILLSPKKAALVLGVTIAEVKRLMGRGFGVEVGGDSYFVVAPHDLLSCLQASGGTGGME